MAKDKPIGGVAAKVLKILIGILSKKIDKVNAQGLKPLLENIAGTLKRIVTVLSDDNPDNKTQLKEVQKEAIIENVVDYHTYVNDNLLSKLQDQSLKSGALLLLNASKEVTLALTDDDPNNGDQLKEILENYDKPSTEIAQQILVNAIKKKIEKTGGNETLQDIIDLLDLIDVSEIVEDAI